MIQSNTPCPCQSNLSYQQCCQSIHQQKNAPDALTLMRSRYSAFALGLIDYIIDTTLPSQQSLLNKEDIANWSQNSTWLGLQITEHHSLDSNHASVTFIAHWQENNQTYQHQEHSIFVYTDNQWFFIDPTVLNKASRNEACICGSHKKFKKCCGIYL